MRILNLSILFSLLCSNAFGCNENMKLYINECKAQDRFQLLASEFQTYSIVISDLKGFKIPKALGKSSYFGENYNISIDIIKDIDKCIKSSNLSNKYDVGITFRGDKIIVNFLEKK